MAEKAKSVDANRVDVRQAPRTIIGKGLFPKKASAPKPQKQESTE